MSDVFTDKTVVITGGTAGIGERMALDLLARGSRVVVCSHDPASVSAFCERAGSQDRLLALVCDVRSTEQVNRFAQDVEQRLGRVDILVNNAGYAVYRPFEESTTEEVLDIVDVSLGGAMRCTQAFLPGMIAARSGGILNVSSVAGYLAITPNAAYCGAKHGLVGWSRALSYELARFGIWVGVLCPDHVPTRFQDHPTFRRRDKYRTRQERLTVGDVSEAALEAIRTRRPVTFVPGRLAAVAWAMRLLPFVSDRLWGRMMHRRVEQLYDEIEQERRSGVRV